MAAMEQRFQNMQFAPGSHNGTLSNKHWPEKFGFSIWGGGPCFILTVDKNSIAHRAGVLPGDQLLEIDGHDVARMSNEAVKTLARHCQTVPPTIGVVSRLQYVEILPHRHLGYAFTVQGSRPVVVNSVNPFGPAYQVGLREGDIVLQVNGHFVKTSEAVQTLLASHYGKLVLGILAFDSNPLANGRLENADLKMRSPGSRVLKAKDLFSKMNEILGNDYEKKIAVVGVLKQYAEDRQVERLSRSLALLLKTPQQRKLISEIRPFIPIRHRYMFNNIVDAEHGAAPEGTILASTAALDSNARLEQAPGAPWRPDLRYGDIPRVVTVDRGDGSFGFILRGHNPVFIESVDPNGAADKAGLRAGDCILKLNGLDVRECSHSHLVKLLQGSGNHPRFEVQQVLDTDGMPIRPHPSDASTSSYGSSSWMKDTCDVVDRDGRTFQQRADHLLTAKEKEMLKRAIARFTNTRDIVTFVEEVVALFDTPSKRTLWMFLLPRMSAENKEYAQKRINVPRDVLYDVYPIDQQSRILRARKTRLSNNSDTIKSSTSSNTGSSVEDQSILPEWVADVGEMNHLGSFKQQLEYLLTPRERVLLKRILQTYLKNRNIHNLVEDLCAILDTPSKRTLWLYIIPLLSDDHQLICRRVLSIPQRMLRQEFRDHMASRSPSTMSTNSQSSGEEVFKKSSAGPQDGDVHFHNEDEFKYIGKAAAMLRNEFSDCRSSGGSSDDTCSRLSPRHSFMPSDASTPGPSGLVNRNQLYPGRHWRQAHGPISGFGTSTNTASTSSFSSSNGSSFSSPRFGNSPREVGDGAFSFSPKDSPKNGMSRQFFLAEKSIPSKPLENSTINVNPYQCHLVTVDGNEEDKHPVLKNIPAHVLNSDAKVIIVNSDDKSKVSNGDRRKISESDIEGDDLKINWNNNIEDMKCPPGVSEEAFKLKLETMKAIKALDDAVAEEYTDEETSVRADTPRIPPAPPPPPAPPLPPPLPPQTNGRGSIDDVDCGSKQPMQVKRLNWEKLEVSNKEKTVWGQIGDANYLHDVVNYLELEQKFSTKKTELLAQSFKKDKNNVAILSSKKAYNTAILLGHLKMHIPELKRALLNVDEEIFTPELLQQMIAYSPDEDEIVKYNSFAGRVSELSKPDQFGLEMTRIPGYEQRLRAMLFKANFAEKVEEVRDTLNCIKKASQQLMNSKKLAKCLELVLVMGNRMNKGNSRIGEASAFKVNYLSQLDTTKTTDGKSTFIHVLAGAIHNQFPEYISLREDLPQVSQAAKVGGTQGVACEVSNDSIAQELNDLRSFLKNISNEVDKLENLDSKHLQNDRFREVMSHFNSIASVEIHNLYSLQTETVQEFQKMLQYFGENPETTTTNDIFRIFASFISKFEKAHYENQQKLVLSPSVARRS
ncbi:delphilin-like isoform X2 [Tubulanus polymorphus]|uniref:delphilin-like isoform X2 n=1 Tax=Tubulanus polymorphus TaxID=672921 RepID=UPI003DA4D45D